MYSDEFISAIEYGIPIEKLEKRLRPMSRNSRQSNGWRDYSTEGFIGENESLLETIYSDWQLVEKYGTTHANIANALEKVVKRHLRMGEVKHLNEDYEQLGVGMLTAGTQSCPWGCATPGGTNAGYILKRGLSRDQINSIYAKEMESFYRIMSAENPAFRDDEIEEDLKQAQTIEGKYARLTTLLPHLIRDHYFFEGDESPYRASPEILIPALNIGVYSKKN